LAAISKIVAEHKLASAAVLTALAALAVFSAVIFLLPAQGGWTVIKGVKTVSDGRLSTTIDNYSYVSGTQLGPGWGGNAMFLLTYVTIVNVGNGNASVGSFFVNVMMGQVKVGNTNIIGSSVLPGAFPLSLSKSYGGLNLVPHEQATGWIAFYLPNVSESNIPTLNFVSFYWYEQSYGGNYVGNGGYLPPIEHLKIEFVVTP
jgi:hypothetical protein